ncbi:MAG: glycoside hydrolase family 15 protein, partial [Acidobacteriota bacterium]|nr:glycoside hydrolase family 15 protein [Acidobacteriota bacterium]
MKFKIASKTLILLCLSGLFVSAVSTQVAPGGPGADAQWASAGKQGVGTSASLESKIWFTLQGGALTDVYYPNVAVNNVHMLQFVVVDPKTKKVETERDDADHEIKVLRPDSLTFQQINTAKSRKWKIKKTYVTNPSGASIWFRVSFETKDKDLALYLYYDPSLANSGMGDTATVETAWIAEKVTTIDSSGRRKKVTKGGADTGERVIASFEKNIWSLISVFGSSTSQHSAGFVGENDGLFQLRTGGRLFQRYELARNGNIAQIARIDSPGKFDVALSFGKNLTEVFQEFESEKGISFEKAHAAYEKGWADYVSTLPRVDSKYQAQFNMAAMQLKAHEDKTYRGANIASLTVPWGGGDNANEDNVGGYHLVWSRDLYQVFTAYLALGDRAAAERALDFLLKVQQKPDGSFPQNSWLDGKPFWGSLQMDEVAYPLIMAYQLGKEDRETYEKHLKKAADFIVSKGPSTPQERWEEEAGYSPSTIAAEIAGLVCVAEIAKKNGDHESAQRYLRTADAWESNIEKWTVTTNGKYGDGNYYIRIAQNGKPDAGETIELNNGAGEFKENEIVDAGFLELVRLGIRSPNDPLIRKSLKVIDEVIRVDTPNGEGFYRYNNDGYGEMDDGRRWNWDGKYTGKGRLWVLLSGERGQYELALAEALAKSAAPEGLVSRWNTASRARLDHMLGFANEGLMIPEQVWDKKEVPVADSQFSPNLEFGEGTGSATPLAWSMAQFIRLATNLKAGKNLDTPDVVYRRYAAARSQEQKAEQNTSSPRDDCERGRMYVPPGGGTLSGPHKTDPSPRVLFKGEDESIVLFTHFGPAKSVEISGDFTGWKTCNIKFRDFQDSRVLVLRFPNTARIEYKLIVDGEWITDPLNPKKIDNGVGGENSVVEMPGYKPTEWARDFDSTLSAGISEVTVKSAKFGERKVKVYIPTEYFKRGIAPKLPVLYLQDGTEYIERAKAINILENLTSAGKVKPFMIVFIDPADRMKEYWANDDWADFMALELVPAIENKYFNTIATGREYR